MNQMTKKVLANYVKTDPIYFVFNAIGKSYGLVILEDAEHVICIVDSKGNTKCWSKNTAKFIPPVQVLDDEMFEISQNLDEIIEKVSNPNIILAYKGELNMKKDLNNQQQENKERARYDLTYFINGTEATFSDCTFIKDESTIRIWTKDIKGCIILNGNTPFIAVPVQQ